ncbi:hypothetical protein LTR50_002913 [Elasticomyces elasticus]|nr:hypothetical protein LTR50_002913 [Elasticomyces elasticus]
MAEIAAGALVAEQVLSTTIEGGVIAGYAVAQPTMPLKATFSQLAVTPDGDSLKRSHHTVSVVGDKAYIFGGEVASNKLAGNEVHIFSLNSNADAQYSCIPALPLSDGGAILSPRAGHTAIVDRNNRIVVFGGHDHKSEIIDNLVYAFDTEEQKWSLYAQSQSSGSQVPARTGAGAIYDASKNLMIIVGGAETAEHSSSSVFAIDLAGIDGWEALPDLPVATKSPSVAFANETIWVVAGSSPLSSDVHSLSVHGGIEGSKTWRTVSFPTNPLAPGPRPRFAAGLLLVTTGYGRQYLLHFFGSRQHAQRQAADEEADGREEGEPLYWSDMWTYQLPSAPLKPTGFADLVKPAAIKDAIRHKLGYDSGGESWAEVEVKADEQSAHEGKVHPGPRSYFGSAVMGDGRSIILWGGLNPRGEREGDGWVVRLE